MMIVIITRRKVQEFRIAKPSYKINYYIEYVYFISLNKSHRVNRTFINQVILLYKSTRADKLALIAEIYYVTLAGKN